MSGCYRHTEEILRKKRRKVRLDSEGESEGTSLDSWSRFEVDLYLPIIDQIFSSMKTRIEAYDRLQSCTNQQPPQRGGAVPDPVWVGSK